MDPASLELKGAGAVDGWDRGVGLLHPVHQPLDLTVAAEGIPSKVPANNTKSRETCSWQVLGPRNHLGPDTYRSVRMSSCWKRSRGSSCRLLLDRDLTEEGTSISIRRWQEKKREEVQVEVVLHVSLVV